MAPLSGVAPLRESASVFAAAWGSVRLGEAASRARVRRRVGASLLIVGGAILLAVAAEAGAAGEPLMDGPAQSAEGDVRSAPSHLGGITARGT